MTNSTPVLGFEQTFASGTGGIVGGSDNGSVTRTASGVGGITAPDGDGFYGLVTETNGGDGAGPYTYFGGPSSEFTDGQQAGVRVYLDTNWATSDGFQYSVAANGSDGAHQRDFTFQVRADGDGHIEISGSNGTTFDPVTTSVPGAYLVEASGWYTLQHVFHDVGGVLSVDLNLVDADGVSHLIGSLSDPSDTIGSEVGGIRYGWFTDISLPNGLAVDDYTRGTFTGHVVEDSGTYTATGGVAFTDVDTTDMHFASFSTPENSAYIGSFAASVSNDTNSVNGDNQGSVNWTFTTTNDDIIHLGAGETLTQTYTITLFDGQGGAASRDVTVLITGTNDAPVLGFAQTFASNTDGIVDGGDYGSVVRTASGVGGITAPDGDGFYGLIHETNGGDGAGPFTYLGGPSSEFTDGQQAGVRVYLDTNWATSDGFQYSVAANGSDGAHQRDFTFQVRADGDGHLEISGSNGTTFDPVTTSVPGAYLVEASGWYTLQHVFHDVGGVLSVDLNLVDADGVSHLIGTLSDPSDTIGVNGQVGGVRYGWFTDISVPSGLAVDDQTLGVLTGHVVEDSGNYTSAGVIAFTDVDTSDVHSVSAAPLGGGAGYVGMFTPTISNDSGTDGTGAVTWSFTANNADLKHLAAGQIETQTYVLTLSDGHGGMSSQNVTVTLVGVSDPGVAAADSFSTNEATAIGSGFNVFADNGHGADVDNSPSVAAVNGVAGNVGTQITLPSGALLTLNADGTFDYDPNGAFNDLPGAQSGAANLTATDTFTYTLAGGGSATVTVTAHGVDTDGDNLIGTTGADTLNGGIGADTMSGGLGDDTYYVDNFGDHVIDVIGGGTDNVQASVSFNLSGQELENLQLRTSANINGTGNSIANIINGNSGNNIIDGLGGADTMSGAQGNDTYYVDNAGDRVIDVTGQGTDNVFSSVSFNLSGQELENLTLTGAASINGTGNSIANIITGNSGNNIIDGLGGADTMQGGFGNDTYFVDNAGDLVMDVTGQGTDSVFSSVSFNLSGQELENLTLTGAASINGTGNSIANVITGNSGMNTLIGLGGDDTLDGKEGADTMQGGIGNDTYYVDNAGDLVVDVTGQGTDNVQAYVSFNLSGQELENLQLRTSANINGTGNSIANIINGNSGNNIIDGLGGADTMSGAQGNDTYYVDNAGDLVIDVTGQGTDSVFSSVTFNLTGQELENLTLTGAASTNGTGNSIANTITGNSGINILTGLGGDDTLDGKEGGDTMQGGIGNDTYYVDNAGDHVIDVTGQGTDNVQASVSFNLSGQELENLQLRTSANINGTGNSIANVINGNSGINTLIGLGGNDTLDGKEGADTMQGGIGNDTYYVDNAGDHVIDVTGQGTDNVQAYVSFNLSGQELENLQLRTSASINGTGNSIANVIAGNSGNNVINGLGGNDTLTGAQGHDSFVFTTALNASTNVDHITDFSVFDDTIQLDHDIFAALGGNGTLSADQFVANASGTAANASQHIIYETDTGWLYYDSNGTAAGGSTHFATVAANLAVTNADFVVV